jgi:hypothetical protein
MAVNAASSRILGTSLFEVVFAQKPHMPLHQAVAAPPPAPIPAPLVPSDAPDTHEDPLDRVRELPRIAKVIFEEVRRREEEYARVRRQITKRTLDHPQCYRLGSYVLLRRPPTEKLDFKWKGPYLLINKNVRS